jgi:hypothetical protein
MKRDTIPGIVIVCLALAIAGCAAMDSFFTPDPETNVSPAQEVGQSIVDAGDGAIAGPYGEIGLAALMLIQNGYLLVRRIQNRKKDDAA